MNPSELEIKVDDLRSPEINEFLAEHLRCLAEVSPPESMHALNHDELRAPGVTFWSVWSDRELVGCGALKQLDSYHGEIKSMRTAKTCLRRGIATLLLEHIISEAHRRGYHKLSLETGSMEYFEPARGLYRKNGFRSCPPFGDYREDPNSVFMTREL
jgi:putative acetyltransferase